MARIDTIEALRRRGISKKTAETLADAGFTVETLRSANPDRVGKFISAKEVKKVLAKVHKEEPASRKREPRAARPGAAAEAAEPVDADEVPEAPPKIPDKVPVASKEEQDIYHLLEGMDRTLPRQVVWDLVGKMRGLKITKKQLQEVVRRTVDRYDVHRVDANESAGIVSAQSIGEPGTQMSLRSDERVIVRQDGRVRILPIGDLVDSLMSPGPVSREGGTEWRDLPSGLLEVPSLGSNGRVAWSAVRAVSRHVCREPLLRLRTRTGREITATRFHSFVTRLDGRIVPVAGRDLRTGDRLPVVRRWSVGSAAKTFDLGDVLPMEEYWYGSELAKARAMGSAWRSGLGREYRVPIGADELGRQLRGHGSVPIEDGFVYPYQNHSRARIPSRLALDANLGWLVGAYLSEGWASRYEVNISNTDERFLARTRAVSDRFGIGHAEYEGDRGFGHTHDLHLRSAVLGEFLRRTCGSGSAEKRVPEFSYGSSDEFVSALLRAYFDGDGNVSVARGAIRASSNSKDLMDGIALLLGRFGILSSKGRTGRQRTLWIPGRYAPAFRDAIGFESDAKRESLDRLCRAAPRRYTYDALDMISGFGTLLRDVARKSGLPSRYVNNFTRRQRIGRATLRRYVQRFEELAADRGIDLAAELGRMRALLDEDVCWDDIVEIGETAPSAEPVYDLAVPGFETFTTAEGIVTHNTMRTFHYAGVAEMNVTLGLPRLIEIVDARRLPSTPLMEIHLRPKAAKDVNRVKEIAQEIEMTKLEDIADIEADMVNMRVVVYPDAAKMKSRGVKADELEQKLKKFSKLDGTKRTVGGETKTVDAYGIESGEASFKKLQRLVEGVRVTKVKGIDNIKRAIIGRPTPEGRVIYTEGSNLAKVLDLPDVDASKTSTNSVEEIYETLGIEAARNAIIKEAHDTLSEQGLTVDIRHIMLVADMMTNDGDVKAIGRHGISGRKSSVLARAAFEITAHHLLRAAITGEVDYLDGVAENVIVGQPVTLGTGAVNLVYRPPAAAARKKATPPPTPAEAAA